MAPCEKNLVDGIELINFTLTNKKHFAQTAVHINFFTFDGPLGANAQFH